MSNHLTKLGPEITISISSGHISAAIIDRSIRTPTILFKVSQEIPGIDSSFCQQIDRFFVGFQSIIRKLQNSLSIYEPSKVNIFVGPAWYNLFPRNVRYRHPESFVVTKEIIDSLVNDELDEIERFELSREILFDGEESFIFHYDVSEVKLNEYPYENPLNTATRDIDISLLVAVAPRELVDRLVRYVDSAFNIEPDFSIQHSLFSKLIDDQHAQKHIGVIVDKDITEIFLIESKSVHHTYSIPFGYGNFIYQGLKSTGRPLLDIKNESYIRGRNLFSDATYNRIDARNRSLQEKWTDSISQVIRELSTYYDIPNTIYLITEPEYRFVFKSTIESDNRIVSLFGSIPPKVQDWNPYHLVRDSWQQGLPIGRTTLAGILLDF